MKTFLSNAVLLLLLLGVLALADPLGLISGSQKYPVGSIGRAEGLRSWALFFQVAAHPRCVNCHADDRPMWSGPSYGETRPHGMNIVGGDSRSGDEAVPCRTCHIRLTKPNPAANRQPHAPPKVASVWQLPPREAAWFGRSSREICVQLRDPGRNGDRTISEVAAHLGHDLVLRWAWAPGGTREPAPHSLAKAQDALLRWGAAGTPCPE